MKNLKNTKILIATIAIIGSATLLSGCTGDDNSSSTTENIEAPSVETPDRPSEINGLVRSIEGNEVIVANEIRERALIEGEQDSQRDERQALSQEERQALKAEEAENLEIENVTITIPVGVPVIKGSGVADGASVLGELAEIKTGVYISMWLDENGQVEAVKLKGVN